MYLFGGKEEGAAHLAIPQKFLRKLAKSVVEKRRTEPAEEGLLYTSWIAQRRQAGLMGRWAVLFGGREEATAHELCCACFGKAQSECERENAGSQRMKSLYSDLESRAKTERSCANYHSVFGGKEESNQHGDMS